MKKRNHCNIGMYLVIVHRYIFLNIYRLCISDQWSIGKYFQNPGFRYTKFVYKWSNYYLGLEVLDTVEHVMPFPCLCVVAAGGVGHGMVVILPNPLSDWVVGIPSPAILCPRCWVGWKNNMYIRIYNQIFKH